MKVRTDVEGEALPQVGASVMAKSNLRLVPPITENRAVGGTQPPRRPPNRELREREHLKDAEVERLIEAARDDRHGYRDAQSSSLADGRATI